MTNLLVFMGFPALRPPVNLSALWERSGQGSLREAERPVSGPGSAW